MEQDDLTYLSDQAQEAYMAFQRKFESDDWKATVEWAQQQAAQAASRQLASQSWDHFLVAKGQRLSYMELINLESSVENEFLSAVADARAKSIAEDEGEHE